MHLILIVTLLAILNSSAVWAEGKRPYKIGFISDLSGPVAIWGKQGQLGAEIALDELRQEGHDVQLVTGDSALDPKRGLSEVQKMLFSDSVDAFYVDFTPIVNAVAPVLKSRKKLFIGSAGAKSFIDQNPYAFKVFVDYEKGCADIAAYWKEKGVRKPGLLKITTEFGELCARAARGVFPQLVETNYNRADNVASQVLALRRAGVDLVFHTGYESDADNFLKELEIIKWKVPLTGGADDLLAEHVTKNHSARLEGAVGFGLPLVSEELLDKMRKKDPVNSLSTPAAAALAYTFVKQLGRALGGCPRDDVACQAKKLSESGPEPALRFIGWRGHVAGHEPAFFEWKGGKKVSLYQ